MATDATGTPTSPDSIPKYNTAVDAPSGKGLNAIVDFIQTLLNGVVRKVLTTTTGDMIYASSANTPARLGIGSTGQVLTVAGGIPAWSAGTGLKTTVGTLAAGPPGSPATNDLWIATDVDANGTVWTFRYNSAEATYKWEFIGGPPLILRGTPGVVINTLTQVAATGWYYNPASMSYTTARGGDYLIDVWLSEDANGGAGQGGAGVFADVTAPYGVGAAYENLIVGLNTGITAADRVVSIASAKLIGGCCQSTNVALHKLSSAVVKITPIRII
jgi:hypothetical protein